MKIDGSGQRKTSERHVLTRTREAGGAHRIQVIAWQSVLLSGIRHDKLVHRYPRGIILWRDGLKPVIYLCSSMKLAFFMDVEV